MENNQKNTTNAVITNNTGMQNNTAEQANAAGAQANAANMQANATGMQANTGMQNAQLNAGTMQASAAQGTNVMQTSGAQTNQAKSQGKKTVIGVFNSRSAAEKAVNELRQRGFTAEEISIVSKDQRQNSSELYDDDITDGALTGGTIGGIGGLLLGAGALAIPGMGPIVAAGPIAAALSGAVAGGIAGGLIDWGIPAEASRRYEQSVARGGILAAIQTTQDKVNLAAQILRQYGATDVETHNKNT